MSLANNRNIINKTLNNKFVQKKYDRKLLRKNINYLIFKIIENEYRNVLDESWNKACKNLKIQKSYFTMDMVVGVGDHAAIDVSRLTKGEKAGFSLGSSIASTSLANDEGYDNLFKSWLVKLLIKEKIYVLLVLHQVVNQEIFLNALDYLEEKKLTVYILQLTNLKKTLIFTMKFLMLKLILKQKCLV